MKHIVKILSTGLFVTAFCSIAIAIFLVGRASSTIQPVVTLQPTATSTPKIVIKSKSAPVLTLSGPAVWEAVNKRRVEFGVNPLGQKDELCTIASIRLNQLLTLGTLDGHEGFGKLPEERPDLKWIFEKYNVAEFLVSGADSPQNAVDLWENTLGHKKLLTGGEYSWGCIYAQNGFGVAIAAY